METDLAEMVLNHSHDASLSCVRGPFSVFTGQYFERTDREFAFEQTVSQIAFAAGQTQLEFETNARYGIPFFDGARTPQEHLAFLQAHVHAPQPMGFEMPTAAQIQAVEKTPYYLDAFGNAFGSSPDNEIRRSGFDDSLDALAYALMRLPFDQRAVAQTLNQTGGALLWQRRNQGFLKDKICRLETLYVLQNGLSFEQKEQQLANAMAWLDTHENLTSVSVLVWANANNVFRAASVMQKASAEAVFFKKDDRSITSAFIDVRTDEVSVLKPTRFYWIVRKGQKHDLKKTYSVTMSYNPTVSTPPEARSLP